MFTPFTVLGTPLLKKHYGPVGSDLYDFLHELSCPICVVMSAVTTLMAGIPMCAIRGLRPRPPGVTGVVAIIPGTQYSLW